MKIHYIPLENLEQRYTIMMNKAIEPYVDTILYPKQRVSGKIESGQFLDIFNTCTFKARQLELISLSFKNNEIKDGDVFLVGDIFFPGIEMIKYMSELQGITVKVYGFNYAGRADSTDFVRQLGNWSDYSEKGYHLLCDGIFVGSYDHKKNVVSYFDLDPNKVHVSGLIWDLDFMDSFNLATDEKNDFVIWPHRFSNEKGIKELKQFAELTDKKIVVTSSGPHREYSVEMPRNVVFLFDLTKAEYYTLFSKARWYLSTAYQETFGYTIQEAIYFRCNILVPNRACSPEMVEIKNIYNNVTEIDTKFNNEDLVVDYSLTEKWDKNIKNIIDIIRNA